MAPVSSPPGVPPTDVSRPSAPLPQPIDEVDVPNEVEQRTISRKPVATTALSQAELFWRWHSRIVGSSKLKRILTPNDWRVIGHLGSRIDPSRMSKADLPEVEAGRDELATASGGSPGGVVKSLTRLEENGVIGQVGSGGGPGKFNTYELITVPAERVPFRESEPGEGKPNVSDARRLGENQPPSNVYTGDTLPITNARAGDTLPITNARAGDTLPDRRTLYSIQCNALNALQCNAPLAEVLITLTLDRGAAIVLARHPNCSRAQLRILIDRLDEVRTTISQFIHDGVHRQYGPRKTVEQKQIEKLPEHRQEEIAARRELHADTEGARKRKEEEAAQTELDRRMEEAIRTLPRQRLSELAARALLRIPEHSRPFYEAADYTAPHWHWPIWQELQSELADSPEGGSQ